MLKKKIAAAVAAIMTISSLGIVALAEVADGQTYDQLLGNELVEGTFENGINVGADRWVPKLNVKKVMDNTHGGSAGAMLADQSVSTVYSGFSMKSNRIYHAEAYIKLFNNVQDKAKFVLATKNGDTFTPIASTAVKTDVNGTGWTKLEGDFVRTSASADSANIYCYVELDNETKFYLDDVIIKDTNYIYPNGAEIVSVTDENGKACFAGKLVAGSDGAVYLEQTPSFLAKTDYVMTAWVMLEEDSETETAKAYIKYAKGFGMATSDKTDLVAGEKKDVIAEGKPNTGSSAATKKLGIGVEGAAEGDVIYFGIKAEPKKGEAAAAAAVTIDSFDTLAGQNTATVLSVDANTVALRYFYSVDGTILKTGHTNSGDIAVPAIMLDASYIGKNIKLEVEPMNEDLVYGSKVTATSVVKAPFESGEITPTVDATARRVTSTVDVTNTSGDAKYVAAIVAYYNAKDEMIGIGIENKQIADGDTETFNVTVNDVEPVTGDYSKLYLLDGDATGSALALFPLAEAK